MHLRAIDTSKIKKNSLTSLALVWTVAARNRENLGASCFINKSSGWTTGLMCGKTFNRYTRAEVYRCIQKERTLYCWSTQTSTNSNQLYLKWAVTFCGRTSSKKTIDHYIKHPNCCKLTVQESGQCQFTGMNNQLKPKSCYCCSFYS